MLSSQDLGRRNFLHFCCNTLNCENTHFHDVSLTKLCVHRGDLGGDETEWDWYLAVFEWFKFRGVRWFICHFLTIRFFCFFHLVTIQLQIKLDKPRGKNPACVCWLVKTCRYCITAFDVRIHKYSSFLFLLVEHSNGHSSSLHEGCCVPQVLATVVSTGQNWRLRVSCSNLAPCIGAGWAPVAWVGSLCGMGPGTPQAWMDSMGRAPSRKDPLLSIAYEWNALHCHYAPPSSALVFLSEFPSRRRFANES